MSTPEGKLKAQVRKWLDSRGWYYYMPSQNGRGRVGIPDFICAAPSMNGRLVGIETKAPGKRHQTTANQDREIRDINKAGGLAIVIDDVSQLEKLEGL